MKKFEGNPQIKFSEGKNIEMAYSADFKALIKKHRKENPLAVFLNLTHSLENLEPGKNSATESKMTITRMPEPEKIGPFGSSTRYKLEYHGYTFFVKRDTAKRSRALTRHFGTDHTPTAEMKSTVVAKNINFFGIKVEIIEPQFAFIGDGYTYLISEWRDLPVVRDLLLSMASDSSEENVEKREQFFKRASSVLAVLKSKQYVDASFNNMFYDEQEDKFVLFDLHSRLIPQRSAP